jgi:hypothetical protein
MTHRQWVNLTRDPKWCSHIQGDGAPRSEERVGPVRFRVKFRNGTPANFKTRVVAKDLVAVTGGEGVYEKEEEDRNERFKTNICWADSNQGEATLELPIDVSLPAAGGITYTVQAKHMMKEVEGPVTVETCRALFYFVVVQDPACIPTGNALGNNVAGAIDDPATNLTRFEQLHWKPRGVPMFIKLENKGSATVAFGDLAVDEYEPDSSDPKKDRLADARYQDRNQKFVTIGGADYEIADLVKGPEEGTTGHESEWLMMDSIKRAIPADLAQLKPNFFVVVFCHQLSDKSKCVLRHPVSRVEADEVVVPLEKCLWQGVDPSTAPRSWLVDCDFIAADGQRVKVPNPALAAAGPACGDFGGYMAIRIDLTAPGVEGVRQRLHRADSKGGTFEITCHVVRDSSAGYEAGPLNFICIADTMNFAKVTPGSKLRTLVHELGHLMGMTATGGRPALDNQWSDTPNAPATLYGNIPGQNDHGHSGNHCMEGVKYTEKRGWQALPRQDRIRPGPQCVMFGAEDIGAAHPEAKRAAKAPAHYCWRCEPIVQKLDLSDLFHNSVTD